MAGNKINILDEKGEIAGEATREDVHQKGLLHREVHVLFYTPHQEIILQHRAKDKDTYPNLLDATVGGHIDIGESIIGAAVRETKEETGVEVKADDLKFLKLIKRKSFDNVTSKINNAIKYEYGYCYDGKIEDLEVEEGKIIAFEAWPLEKLINPVQSEKSKFIPFVFEKEFKEIFEILLEKSTDCEQK